MKALEITMKQVLLASLTLVALELLTGIGHSQFMLSPVAVTETGLGSFSDTSAPLGAMINQSGLNVPFQNVATDFDTYFAPPNNNFSKNADKTKWQSDFSFTLPFGGLVDFDLGQPYRVSKVAIWNVSVKELAVQVGVSTNGPWQDAGQFTLTDQQSSLSLRSSVLDLGAEYTGQYVRLDITSEYPANLNPLFGYVTIGEVVTRAAPAISVPLLSIRIEANGDTTLSFSGVLQSSSNIDGRFEDVQGNPQQIYTIPRSNLSTRQFFRTRN
jgi:hypothetical protein